MRILVDCRCLQKPPPRSGVGVLTEGMLRALLAEDSTNEYLLFANGLADPRRHLPRFDSPNVRWVIRRIPNKLLNGAWGLGLPTWRFPQADVALIPNPNFLPHLPPDTPLVLIVHDLSFVHFRDCFTPKQRLLYRLMRPRELLRHADAIIAVSRTTARDVVETYGIPEERIHVVYPGITSSSFRAPTECWGEKSHVWQRARSLDSLRSLGMTQGTHFILTLSAIEPRKNIDGLIAAYELLSEVPDSKFQIPDLVIAGIPGATSRTIARQIARSHARSRIHLIGTVPEHDKRALLALADCFAYVSFWEGFGFPALEAMVAGVPVVASTGGALPEILNDAALLVDPLDPAAIARALHAALTDADIRAELVQRGRARAAQYSWAPAAAEIRNVLASVARGPSPKYP